MSRRGISQRDIIAMSHQPSLGPTASMESQPQSSIEKIIDEAAANKAQLNTVSCMYQTHIAGYWRNLTILWCKNIFSHTLNLVVNSLEGEFCYSCKIEIKPWPFWNGKKGSKTFQVEGCQVDLYWDLRSARYSGSAEPSSDYYVAMVSDEEIALLIGDYKKKAYKRTKARPALVDSVLYLKKENVFAKKSFSTRARFDERKQENEIVVESSTTGPKEPEMWISIDGIIMIHVKNLQWKFRGNQTVTVNKQPVQVFWDVHDWLFTSPGTGNGLFIFKPGPAEFDDVDDSPRGTSSDTSDRSMYFSTKSIRATPEFCLILYAWKVE